MDDIQPSKKIQYVSVMVVEANELMHHQEDGWVLIKVLKETRIVDVRHAMEEYRRRHGHTHWYDANQEKNPVGKVKTHLFLMGKLPLDHAVSVLQEEKSNLYHHLNEALSAQRTAQRALEIAEKDKTDMARSLEATKESAARRCEEASRSLATSLREVEAMKTDLKKIWQALGDLRMKEILGRDKL